MEARVNLSSININLLNVLNILLREKSPSSAAKKLNLSQAAVTHSLKKLRDIFNDELLISTDNSKTMQLILYAPSIFYSLNINISLPVGS